MYLLKAICDFDIGSQDRVAQAKHPHFFSETDLSQIKCVQTSQQTEVLFFILRMLKKVLSNTFTTLRGDKIHHYHTQTRFLKMCIHLVYIFSTTQPSKTLVFSFKPENQQQFLERRMLN